MIKKPIYLCRTSQWSRYRGFFKKKTIRIKHNFLKLIHSFSFAQNNIQSAISTHNEISNNYLIIHPNAMSTNPHVTLCVVI